MLALPGCSGLGNKQREPAHFISICCSCSPHSASSQLSSSGSSIPEAPGGGLLPPQLGAAPSGTCDFLSPCLSCEVTLSRLLMFQWPGLVTCPPPATGWAGCYELDGELMSGGARSVSPSSLRDPTGFYPGPSHSFSHLSVSFGCLTSLYPHCIL